MGKILVVANRKGGCGKSMTVVSLGVGLVRQGKKVLVIDADSQHSLTVSLGVSEPDRLPFTLSTAMFNIINETSFNPTDGIISHVDGVDLMPTNNSLTGIEVALASIIVGRETILKQYIDSVRHLYDYIIVDTSPTMGLLAVNALAAADSVIIPVVPKHLDAKGLELLLKSIVQIRRQINPKLEVAGILLTMVDRRSNFTRNVISVVEQAYGGNIRIFSEHIPHSVRAAESTALGVSIFTHNPNGKVALAYAALVREVLDIA